ncbi:MAG: hypothetical protein R2706_17405 [Acidimicrobiales bacterium]
MANPESNSTAEGGGNVGVRRNEIVPNARPVAHPNRIEIVDPNDQRIFEFQGLLRPCHASTAGTTRR